MKSRDGLPVSEMTDRQIDVVVDWVDAGGSSMYPERDARRLFDTPEKVRSATLHLASQPVLDENGNEKRSDWKIILSPGGGEDSLSCYVNLSLLNNPSKPMESR